MTDDILSSELLTAGRALRDDGSPAPVPQNRQPRHSSWTAAMWSLGITATMLLIVAVVVTGIVTATLLLSADAPPQTATGDMKQRAPPTETTIPQHNSGSLQNVQYAAAAPEQSSRPCDSTACVEQARVLLRQVNASRDPCDDFYEYVCGDWPRTRPLSPGAERISVDTILLDSYAEMLAPALHKNATTFPPLRFLLDQCLHPQPNLFRSVEAIFLDVARLRPWMALSTYTHRKPSAAEVSRKLGVAFRELGIDALIEPFVVLGTSDDPKRFVGLGEPSTVLLAGPLGKEEYELVRRSFAPLLGFFQNQTDADLLQFEEGLALMLGRHQLDNAALVDSVTMKVSDLPALKNIEWTSFLQNVFSKGLRPITERTYVKLNSPDYLVRLARGDFLRSSSDLLGYLRFRVGMLLSPLLADRKARDYVASVSYARHPEFAQVMPQAQYCLRLLDRFEPNLPLYISRKFASSLLGGDGVVQDMVSTLRLVLLEFVQTHLGPISSELRAHLRNKLDAVSWEPLSPSGMENEAARSEYLDGVYLSNSRLSAAQFVYTWMRKSREKRLMAHMSPRSGSTGYPGWTAGFLRDEGSLPPAYERLEIPLPVFDFFLSADPELRPLQLARVAPKVYRPLLRAVYHWAYNFEHGGANVGKTLSGGLAQDMNKLRLCLKRQYASLTWTDRRLQLDASRTSWSDLWDNLAVRPALDAFLMEAHRVSPDYRLVLLKHWSVRQLFFVAYAANFCENSNQRFLRKIAAQGPKSPAWFRVNGVLRNSPEFARAFRCKEGSFMNPVKKCSLAH